MSDQQLRWPESLKIGLKRGVPVKIWPKKRHFLQLYQNFILAAAKAAILSNIRP